VFDEDDVVVLDEVAVFLFFVDPEVVDDVVPFVFVDGGDVFVLFADFLELNGLIEYLADPIDTANDELMQMTIN